MLTCTAKGLRKNFLRGGRRAKKFFHNKVRFFWQYLERHRLLIYIGEGLRGRARRNSCVQLPTHTVKPLFHRHGALFFNSSIRSGVLLEVAFN